MNKKIIISLLIACLSGCSYSGSLNTSVNPVGKASNGVEINSSNNEIYSVKVSQQQGAEISFKISNPAANFSVKANTNGIPEKIVANIDHYLVYLIKNATTTGYPAGSDPLGATDLVAGPFTIPNAGASSKTVKFTGIQPSGTNTYYVAVRAQDAANVDIIKDNNGSVTPWTGTTAATPKVAVSTGNGITVDNAYVITPTTALTVNPNLLNAIGARIDSAINLINGVIPALSSNTSSLSGFITTIAGIGTAGSAGDNGLALSAQLNSNTAVTFAPNGNIFIAVRASNKVRSINAVTGVITTFAGTGISGFSGDNGPATSATFAGVYGVAFDPAGNLFFSDTGNNRVRKVNTVTGIITTYAGNGAAPFAGDGGQATNAQLSGPAGLTTDSSGNVYVTDYGNHRVRKITASTGIITTVAGTGTPGYLAAEDGGQATSAKLNLPTALVVDTSGNLYIADQSNHRVRKVTTAGIITTIAGTGTAGYLATEDGGQATSAKLNLPTGLAIDAANNIYIAQFPDNRVRKLNTSTGIISSIAGNGTACSPSTAACGDGGPATSAQLSGNEGIATDFLGNVYISDTGTARIRKVYK